MLHINNKVAAYSGCLTYLYKLVLIKVPGLFVLRRTSAPLNSKKNFLVKKAIIVPDIIIPAIEMMLSTG